MPTFKEFNCFGEDLERILRLRTSPVAVKMLAKETEIPAGAIRPKKDRGYHLAQCQAFALSRRQKATVAMLKEDNWCWAPLVAYGHIAPELAEVYPQLKAEVGKMPRTERGRYIGIVSAPLKTATFEPDVILIYANNAQLRFMLLALSHKEGSQVNTPLNPIASCAYSVIPSLAGEYRVTLPDPGEYDRALAAEDEIIFSVPKNKIEALVAQLKVYAEREFGYVDSFMEMKPDFPRPEFYEKLFKSCGLD